MPFQFQLTQLTKIDHKCNLYLFLIGKSNNYTRFLDILSPLATKQTWEKIQSFIVEKYIVYISKLEH